MKISILIPVYNEAKNILNVIQNVKSETNKTSHHVFHIVVIDGNSSDGTRKIVEDCMKKVTNLHLLQEKKKNGICSAYITGMNYARDTLNVDAFVEFDGDGQHKASDIVRLVEQMDDGYEYVIGSRYIKDGTMAQEWSLYRKLLSRFGNDIIRFFLKLQIRDVTSGFRLTKIRGLGIKLPRDESELISKTMSKIQILTLMVRGGAKTIEVPIDFLNRTRGESKNNLNNIVETLKVIAKL